MTGNTDGTGGAPESRWADLIRGEYALYTVLVLLGTLLHALQILIIAVIMPTIVGDVGGADFYVWTTVIYTVGAIVGAATIEPVSRIFGRRRGYLGMSVLFMVTTAWCGLATDMETLIVARAVQGFAGGLIVGGCMALIGVLFPPRLRRRIIAGYQGVWMFAQLLGPAIGGIFAEIGWWRGSFWAVIPIIVLFAVLVWLKVPDDVKTPTGDQRTGDRPARAFPFGRLAILTLGVMAVAAAGPAEGPALRIALIVGAVALIWLTFRLDGRSSGPLFPRGAGGVTTVIGLGLWIHFLVGGVQTCITLFLPLLLQVFHGVQPIFVAFVSVVFSFGWTVGTFLVTGWSGGRERLALWSGPILMTAGLAVMTATTQSSGLVVLTLSAFVIGFGTGTHNVHLVARTIAGARDGEEGLAAAALPSFRALGTAFGAALAGMLTTLAGLTDSMEKAAVGDAITFVYGANLLPSLIIVVFMFKMISLQPRVPGASR